MDELNSYGNEGYGCEDGRLRCRSDSTSKCSQLCENAYNFLSVGKDCITLNEVKSCE